MGNLGVANARSTVIWQVSCNSSHLVFCGKYRYTSTKDDRAMKKKYLATPEKAMQSNQREQDEKMGEESLDELLGSFTKSYERVANKGSVVRLSAL